MLISRSVGPAFPFCRISTLSKPSLSISATIAWTCKRTVPSWSSNTFTDLVYRSVPCIHQLSWLTKSWLIFLPHGIVNSLREDRLRSTRVCGKQHRITLDWPSYVHLIRKFSYILFSWLNNFIPFQVLFILVVSVETSFSEATRGSLSSLKVLRFSVPCLPFYHNSFSGLGT